VPASRGLVSTLRGCAALVVQWECEVGGESCEALRRRAVKLGSPCCFVDRAGEYSQAVVGA